MNSGEIALAIVGVLGTSGALGAIIGKRVAPKTTPLEILQEIQEERGELRNRLTTVEDRLSRVERNNRVQSDYIGVLRRHIADGMPPPPPAWPEGLL